jgi:SAM-dependent methyltransferase
VVRSEAGAGTPNLVCRHGRSNYCNDNLPGKSFELLLAFLLVLYMDRQMQIYWEAFDEVFSTADILKNDFNPVYQFDDQLVDGAIIDIGCGQTSPLIKYAGIPGRKLIGIDNEAFQLKKLRSRMTEMAGAASEEWALVSSDIQHDPLPDGKYAMVILYNILHFFSLKECAEILKKLNEHLIAGSLISICVHSTKYYKNDPANPHNNEYFKHYFTQEDLDLLFTPKNFERLYRADIERIYGKKDQEVSEIWGEKIITAMNIKDGRIKADIRRQGKEGQLEAEIICVYRKQ